MDLIIGLFVLALGACFWTAVLYVVISTASRHPQTTKAVARTAARMAFKGGKNLLG